MFGGSTLRGQKGCRSTIPILRWPLEPFVQSTVSEVDEPRNLLVFLSFMKPLDKGVSLT